MESDDKITIKLNDLVSDDIIIDLNNTYGATTTYIKDTTNMSYDNMSSSIYTSDIDITAISGSLDNSYTITSSSIDSIFSTYTDLTINPDEVERMCKEYPALEKVWRNFKSVYDMVKQDYEGKKKAGELDE